MKLLAVSFDISGLSIETSNRFVVPPTNSDYIDYYSFWMSDVGLELSVFCHGYFFSLSNS